MRSPSCITLLLLAALAVRAEPARPPNIVFILADDLGYGELGCYGQEKIRTPHLDRLAAEGLRFTRHYSGSPVCAPSRCVLMTGKHPGHAYIRDNREAGQGREGQHPIPAEEITLGERLQALGYETACIGKWGLGPMDSTGAPLQQGFDRFFGYNCQRHAHSYYPSFLWDNDQRLPLRNEPPLTGGEKAVKDPVTGELRYQNQGQDYAMDRCREAALAFIRVRRDRPFFLYYAAIAPHLALHVPEDSLAAYRGQWPETPYLGDQGYCAHAEPRAAYAALITRLDRDVGQLVAALDAAGLGTNTLIVFSSDNGPTHDVGGVDTPFFDSAGGLRARKGSLYEGGIRVPAIARWPGRIAAGTTTDFLSGFEDWTPTLLAAAGQAEAPMGLDGVNLLPTLTGQAQPTRDFLYREFAGYGGQQAVWRGDWKAVRQGLAKQNARSSVTELYDLAHDRAEAQDQAVAQPARRAELEALMSSQHVRSPVFAFPGLGEK